MRGPGLRVPGVYAALLDRECAVIARDDWRAVDMLAKDGYCYRRDRRLLESLEADAPVVVRRASLESVLWRRDRPRVRLPFDRSVRSVLVSPADVVTPNIATTS